MTAYPSVKTYRKKPVVSGVGATAVPAADDQVGVALSIPTLEGDMLAQPGDWIIRGVAGEFYPCKPHIFAATYEEVEA